MPDSTILGEARQGYQYQTDPASTDGLWGRWVLANTLGEILGLTTGIGIIYGLSLLFGGIGKDVSTAASVVWSAAALVIIGSAEGIAIGYIQWKAIHPALPDLPYRTWSGATIVGLISARVIVLGAVFPALLLAYELIGPVPETPLYIGSGMPLAAIVGALLGAILSRPQSRILRRFTGTSNYWIAACSVGWAAGSVALVLGIGLLLDLPSVVSLVVFAILLIGISGAIAGAIEGASLIRILSRDGTATETMPPIHDINEPRS